MARTVALYIPVALLLVSGWRALEDGPGGGEAVWVALLALLPALARSWWARAAAAAGAGLVAVRTAFGLSWLDARPFDGANDFVGPSLTRIGDGVLAFYDVSVPFHVEEQPLMHGVVLLAIFAFCLLAGLAIAARRPLAAALVTLVGAAWPATLLSDTGAGRGAAVLGVVLLLLAASDRRPAGGYRPAVGAGAVLVVLAVVAAGSPAVAKSQFLDWKTWDPYDQPDEPVSVEFAWDANYGGITFPKKTTTVMTVDGVDRSVYWRATTLDTFDGTRWVEEQAPIATVTGPTTLLNDPLLPARARTSRNWLRADVTIRALRDRRLPAPSTPVRFEPRLGRPVEYSVGGVARALDRVPRGSRYRVYAYAPRPTPAQLARARPTSSRRGSVESRYLEIAPGLPAPTWGAASRDSELRSLLAFDGDGNHAPYAGLYAAAKRIAGPADSPYAAAVSIEAWLRSAGGFRYDETPRQTPGVPPLAAFVERTRAGYCQHFAGAMALMLRYLGVPARVAAGFTSGAYDQGRKRWTVTDHDAHAWVEVWFDGWGWMPFDPTPGRGELGGSYSVASSQPDLPGITGAVRGAGDNRGLNFAVLGERVGDPGGASAPGGGGRRLGADEGASLLRLLLLLGAVAVALVALVKEGRKGLRRLGGRDPRRVAASCRSELVDFLADQGIAVPRSATPTELAALLDAKLGIDGRAFTSALATARFGQPHQSRAAARTARRELAAVKRLARRRLTRMERARGLVSVRSLGFNPSGS